MVRRGGEGMGGEAGTLESGEGRGVAARTVVEGLKPSLSEDPAWAFVGKPFAVGKQDKRSHVFIHGCIVSKMQPMKKLWMIV